MRLPYVAFVLAAMACAVAHAAILVSVVRSRSAVRDSNVPRPRLVVEIIWAALPALALALVLTATWTRVRAHVDTSAVPVIEIAR